MTFDECRDNLTRIRKAGIEYGYCQQTAWNARGHDGSIPRGFRSTSVWVASPASGS